MGADYLGRISRNPLAVGNIGGKQYEDALEHGQHQHGRPYHFKGSGLGGACRPPWRKVRSAACGREGVGRGDVIPYAVSWGFPARGDSCRGFGPSGGSLVHGDGSVAWTAKAAVSCVKMVSGYVSARGISPWISPDGAEAGNCLPEWRWRFYDDAVVAGAQAVSNGISPDDVVRCVPPCRRGGDGSQQSTMWGHMQ